MGRDARETGHKRVPDPPLRMTGMMFIDLATPTGPSLLRAIVARKVVRNRYRESGKKENRASGPVSTPVSDKDGISR